MADRDPVTPVTVVANDVGPLGGMERHLTELIQGLLRAGHEITVISWSCDLESHPRLRWIRVPGPTRPFALAYPLFLLTASLLVAFRRRGVLHSTGAIVLNRTDVCTVHFCHQAIGNIPAASRTSRSGFAYRLNARACRMLARMAERWCYRPSRTARLIGVSRGVTNELRSHFPKMAERISVIPNGVDTDTFRPAQRSPSAAGAITALFVGSEWERKGLRLAIEAVAACDGAKLVVVGAGDATRYRDIARDLGAAGRVEFVGATTEVAPWYRRADVFLLPTVYETFSLVTYEAAASGLPLLVTPVNGVEDLLVEGKSGWFLERDADRIAGRLRSLRDDPGRRAAMGRRARCDSLDFSWQRMVDRYRDLYAASALAPVVAPAPAPQEARRRDVGLE